MITRSSITGRFVAAAQGLLDPEHTYTVTREPRYPRVDGDFTVLGPSVFASRDREMINWKGENYRRQGIRAVGALEVAREFHESYERQAPDFGYRTREETAVPWAEVPDANRALMEAVVADLLDRGVIALDDREDLEP